MRSKFIKNFNKFYMDDSVGRIIEKISILNSEKRMASQNKYKIGIFAVGIHTDYLMKIIDWSGTELVYIDNTKTFYNGNIVYSPADVEWNQLGSVIISSFRYMNEIEEELLNKYGYRGRIIKLYDNSETCEFYLYDANKAYTYENTSAESLFQNNRWIEYDIESYFDVLENITDCYYQYSIYHKKPYLFATPICFGPSNSDTAIVIQGPIKYEDDFTYNTILFYKKIFPDIEIILSTWDNEKENDGFKLFENINGVSLCINCWVEDGGYSNVIRQMTTAYNGILEAKKMGIRYVLKTRTDQRINALDIIVAFKDASDHGSKIVCSPFERNEYFYFIDYYCFGLLDNMLDFWNPNSIETENHPEIMLYKRYALRREKIDYHSVLSEKQYLEIVKRQYAFYSLRGLHIVWPEYNHRVIYDENPINDNDRSPFLCTEMKFVSENYL